MSIGEVMLYSGAVGVVISIIMILVCLKVFPKKRDKLLKTLSDV